MNTLKTLYYNYTKKIKNINWWNFFGLCVIITFAVLFVLYAKEIMSKTGETIIKNHQNYIWFILPICISIGVFHAKTNKDKTYNPFLLKFFTNPLVASSFVCLTYGVVIDSSIALLYLTHYDKSTISNLPYLDITTVTTTLILALIWGTNGILAMIYNILWPNKIPIGITESIDKSDIED